MRSSGPRQPSSHNGPSAHQTLPSISEILATSRNKKGPEQYLKPDKPLSQPPRSIGCYRPHCSTYTDSSTTSFIAGRQSYDLTSGRRLIPPTKHDGQPFFQFSPQPLKLSDHRSLNGAYSQSPVPPTSVPVQGVPLPPGRPPLPPRRHGVSHLPGQYASWPTPTHAENAEYAAEVRYDNRTRRSLDGWTYQESLSIIETCSWAVRRFAEANWQIAQEHRGHLPTPELLPTEREVSDMLFNVEHARRCLEGCREVIAASRERAREGAKPPTSPHEEHQDAAMHGDSPKLRKSVTEAKKYRNRAAPGRCHSCNRTESPEWRRGPDGVGTLCNACGLHYAKLQRKRVQAGS